MSCWAYCKPESEFYPIFGSEPVPIKSIIPAIPRDPSAPPCYLVLGDCIKSAQLEILAQKLYERWHPECVSVKQARKYILQGLPLATTHFSGVSTDEFKYLAMSDEATLESDFDEVSR